MVLNQNSLPEKYFEKICSIPHVSTHEKELSDYICSVAKDLGYDYYQDELYNVYVYIPASKGKEHIAPILFSGHMDMVGNKEPQSNHNFLTDPLELIVENGILRANGTTLGGDDGVATAYMLALMEDDSFAHPAIECLFTVQEENGCIGSGYFDKSKIQSKRLIGLDAGNEHKVTVGNYCSDKVVITRTYTKIQEEKSSYELGFKGFYPEIGHAHMDITESALGYVANLFKDETNYNLVSFKGGTAENYPPIEVVVEVVCDQSVIQHIQAKNKQSISLEISSKTTNSYYAYEDSKQMIDFILNIPVGLLKLDGDIMLYSFMLGMIILDDEFMMVGSSRCKNSENNDIILSQLQDLANTINADMQTSVRYRSWDYQPDSKLKALYKELVKEVWNRELEESICPGGLEISDFLYAISDMDVLSIGPNYGGCHTAKEWIDLESFNTTYHVIQMLLERLD